MTILAEIYDDPTFFGFGPGFVNRTQSNPGFVNPVRSGLGFVNPIPSDPVRVLLTPRLFMKTANKTEDCIISVEASFQSIENKVVSETWSFEAGIHSNKAPATMVVIKLNNTAPNDGSQSLQLFTTF